MSNKKINRIKNSWSLTDIVPLLSPTNNLLISPLYVNEAASAVKRKKI